jgi:enamine deaminase RidA (YjgF/YER057c/UK114 family)
MNWYVIDKREYLAVSAAMGAAYREIIGANYPVMTLAQVLPLRAKVDIEAMAIVPRSS